MNNSTTDDIPIAHIVQDHCVVWDYTHASELYELEYFGKPVGIRKPNDFDFQRPLQLSLFDAAYLLEFHIIKIIDDKNKKEELNLEQFIEYANNNFEKFDEKYLIYKDLRERGYVVRTGLKFGCDFTVYQKAPGVDHSSFVVQVADNQLMLDPVILVRAGRLASSVKKNYVIATIREKEINYYVFQRYKP